MLTVGECDGHNVTDITSEHRNYMKRIGRIEKMLVDVGVQMLIRFGDEPMAPPRDLGPCAANTHDTFS